MAVRYTDKKAAKYCNKVLANVTSDHPALADPWHDNFNRWFVCDGYRAYRLNKQPDGLMVHWSVLTLSAVMRNKFIMVHNAVESMFDADILEKISEVPTTYETVMDVYRNSDDGTIDLGEDFPVVNVKYLCEAMEMLPGGKVYCTDSAKRMISPVYVISPDGVALILPIRRESKFHWKYTA